MSDSWNPVMFSGHRCRLVMFKLLLTMGEECTGRMARRLLRSGYAESNAASARERGSPRFEGSDCLPPALPIASDIPPGAHTEARSLLLRFNPQLVGFGIASPSPNLCPGISAPNQLCVVEPLTEKNSEDQQ
jgi:hypothetical protein